MISNILITSGPTIEPIDPVRYISNYSSGKTGYYIAEEAKKRGIERIIYISGPSNYIPKGIDVVMIGTAMEMQEQVMKYFDEVDVVIMAAAVSDYAIHKIYPDKIKKGEDTLTLKLIKNPDILSGLGTKKKNQLLVGFAAETENIIANGNRKFKDKNLDLLVLNEISENNPAFNIDDNQVYFISDKGIKTNKKMKKWEIASVLWDEIQNLNLKRK